MASYNFTSFNYFKSSDLLDFLTETYRNVNSPKENIWNKQTENHAQVTCRHSFTMIHYQKPSKTDAHIIFFF